MIIRFSKNTFYRRIGEYGYLTNQLNRKDQFFNETGTDFLDLVSRIPQDISNIIKKMFEQYNNSVSLTDFAQDMEAFAAELIKEGFIVGGNSEEELKQNDMLFSYKNGNPKQFVKNIQESTGVNSQDLMTSISHDFPMLTGLQFELTSRCNERCIHCYIPNNKKNAGKGMPTEKVLDLIDEYSEMGGINVNLSGGEVFLHKDIIKIMQYCREKDLQVNILSNLIALKEEQIPLIKEANIAMLQTSLYSMDERIHDGITTVKGSFSRTKKNIEKLVAADVPVQISCPVMKANKDSYKDVLKYAQSLSCKAQTDFIMMAQADKNTQNLANRISLKETEILIREILQNDENYRNAILTLQPISERIRKDPKGFSMSPLCSAGTNICCIAENGDVYPCPGWQDMVIGNVYDQKLKDIWEKSDKVMELRKITQGDFPKCITCEARDYCSPCLVRNYNENDGNMFKVTQHFCDVAFLTKRLAEEYKSSININ